MTREDYERYAAAFNARDYDAVIANWTLDTFRIDPAPLFSCAEARKEREQPIYLPILLVTSRPGVKMITRHVWRSVDELIVAPIEKAELRARVELLGPISAPLGKVRGRYVASGFVPKFYDDLQRKGIYATLASILGITIYIALRFRFSFAVGAIAATFHDIFVTLALPKGIVGTLKEWPGASMKRGGKARR